MDTHCFVPEVKCLWGCSLFIVEIKNTVAYDAILFHYLGEKFFEGEENTDYKELTTIFTRNTLGVFGK